MDTIFGNLLTALTTVMGWLGAVLDALLSADGSLNALWPLAMVGIAFGIIRMGFGYIKSFTWGFCPLPPDAVGRPPPGANHPRRYYGTQILRTTRMW